MTKTSKSNVLSINGMSYMDYLTNNGMWVTIGKDTKTGYYSRYSAYGICAGDTKENMEAIYGIEIQH